MAGVKKVGKLVICGVGLIGGSFALALRQAGLVERVVGIGRRPEPLAAARELQAARLKAFNEAQQERQVA